MYVSQVILKWTTLKYMWSTESMSLEIVTYPNFSYLSTFNEATLSISGYFHRWEAGFSCSNADIECFSTCSTHCVAAEYRITSVVKVGFSTKLKATVKVSHWVALACCVHPVEMENRATAYGCAHCSVCYIHSVQKFTFRPVESGDVSYTGDSSASAAQC